MNDYEKTIKYLEELNKFGWKPGLERIEKLLNLLGNPHQGIKYIHVGGTNGKGSVTVSLTKILTEQGYKTGQYISPELFDIRERIQINGRWIPEPKLVEYVSLIQEKTAIMADMQMEGPTNFEVWTALAFLYFQEENVDFAVIEVGLGGEIDSTNVIDPLLSIITNVTMDHKDYLGATVEEIAKVKSGIIKKGRTIITGSQDEKVIQILMKKANELESRLLIYNQDFTTEKISLEPQMTKFIFNNKNLELNVEYSLTGSHQLNNGALVIEAICCLMELGYQIDINKVVYTMKKISWPGRLELLTYQGKKVLLDAAHNLDGAKSLAYALQNIYCYENLIMIIGILADKDRKAMIDMIGPLAHKVIVTKPNNDRAAGFEKIAEYFQPYSTEIIIEEDVYKALSKGIVLTGAGDLLCIAGSIYMLKDIRKIFN